ncbi:alpha/beta hydrolase [Rhodococcus sp. IEGM 1366]|uniref:alpha/beta fold hydrolase n=1 Tax=Rhodococcus sp. IEGM 1366 TaxID=3082223 RepID=UPI0029546BC3|nr:alpha/beta hydrolase [Rhodococcus sp. IEGM 1366]MDV8066667.1 alpha/beta hydrolase [Rhodococcus sp. IEGM 1366]
MWGREIRADVTGGILSGIDFGGEGPGVLLVHGTGHNCAAWADVASHLGTHCHAVAFDLRGHGYSEAGSRTAEQYWRDLADVAASLGWERPILVGHSTGGYAVSAATAAGIVTPAAIAVIDGVVLEDRATAIHDNAHWHKPEAAQRLREIYLYGWRVDRHDMLDYVEQCARETDTDGFNAGARPELMRQVIRRCFTSCADGQYLRRPTVEEITMTTAPDPDAVVYPSVDVYEPIECPMTIVLPSDGFYARRADEVRSVVQSSQGRRLIEIDAGHNVPMTRPAELATIIIDLVRQTHTDVE